MTSVAGTGHRPATRKDPDGLRAEDMPWVREKARAGLEWFAERGVTQCWSGFALGWDLELAAAAVDLGLELHARIPYESQPALWSPHNRAEWARLRAAAAHEVTYGPDPQDHDQAAALLKKRNEGLMQGDFVFACWNGQRRGGTWSAVAMAQRLGKPGVHLEPTTRRVRIVEPGQWSEQQEAPTLF